MLRGRLLLLLLLVSDAILVAAAAAAQPAPRPATIDVLHAEARGSDVFLRFHLDGALNPELATKIQTGLETAIHYEIRLYRHNAHWLWDYRMDTREFRVAVTYDPVTREYVIVETMDGRPMTRATTKEFFEATRRLVSQDNLLAFRVRFNDWRTNLYVSLRATFDSRYVLAIIPGDARTPWKQSNRFEVKAPAR